MKKSSSRMMFRVLCFVLFTAVTLTYSSIVSITDDGVHSRYVTSNSIPNHDVGQFPNANNPNTISEQNLSFRMDLNPVENTQTTALGLHPFGVALNGVPFDPKTAEYWNNDSTSGWNLEALSSNVNIGLDDNHAHVQPNGTYHYHGEPTGLYSEDDEMELVGYAADGFLIYNKYCDETEMTPSYQLKSGQRPSGPLGSYDGTYVEDYEHVSGMGDLDECNGHVAVTPESPGGAYHYHITEDFPVIPRMFRGTPDTSFVNAHAPGGLLAQGEGNSSGDGCLICNKPLGFFGLLMIFVMVVFLLRCVRAY